MSRRAVVALVVVLLVGVVVVRLAGGPGDEPTAAQPAAARDAAVPSTSSTAAPTTTSTTTATTTTSTVPPEPDGPTPRRGDGTFEVAGGTTEVVGTGARRRFTVEVEHGTRFPVDRFAEVVESTLFDERSWAGGAEGGTAVAFQRVDEGADLRVVLATPDTADALCAPLRTNGIFSCHQGDRVVVNLMRWREGADASGLDLAEYRRYVVNHEVGHALGLAHRPCPGAGEPAPVMMQQTKGIGACAPNAWPVPAERPGG